MLLVPTYLAPSKLHGLGVFAAAPIKKGEVIWQYRPGFDQEFTPEQIAMLPECAQAELRHYGYVSQDTGMTILCADNARFFNHSSSPATGDLGDASSDKSSDVAARDLEAGDEITADYFAFDADAERKLSAAGESFRIERKLSGSCS